MKALILESVNVWKNYKKRMPSRSSVGVTRPSRSAHGRSNGLLSTLGTLGRMWFSMISARMISFKKVIVKSRQVLHPFLTLWPWRQWRHKNTEGTHYCTQVLDWVGGGGGEECGKEEECF